MADGITEDETGALGSLDSLAGKDAEFARTVVGLPWVADGITEDERWAIAPLVSLATPKERCRLVHAQAVVGLRWVTDDLTEDEMAALSSLDVLAHDWSSLGR